MGSSLRLLALAQLWVLLAVVLVGVPVFGQEITTLTFVPGDVDGDDDVDLDDFVILKRNFGAVGGATLRMGDLNGDGAIDLDDFAILRRSFGGGVVTMDLVRIPAGTFMMGSPDDEEGRYADEGPVHEVTLSQDFCMGVYEVTQSQYQAVMGTNPSYFTSSGPAAPVERVSWNDAVAFCDNVSLLTGRTVTLPTEAQWEYAWRAGSTTRFYYGDDLDYSLLGNYAWYGYWDESGNSGRETHPVGQKTPNAWGLYDMSGNVWEWCADWYRSDYYAYANNVDPQGPQTGSQRVVRGGSWNSDPGCCRSANRNWNSPGIHFFNPGFRVVLPSSGR